MSGTSLDGLDICWVKFSDTFTFDIVRSKAVSYSAEFKHRLANAHTLSGFDLMKLSNDFGLFCSKQVLAFLGDDRTEIDLIASHGHTVFHKPQEKLTTQIGNGAVLYAETGIKTVFDFRSVDVALGGQGAPLVPIGDLLLFQQYQSCLNLGGIANISLKKEEGIIAQDLCFANMLSNFICEKFFNKSYDHQGEIGSKGVSDDALVSRMIEFHQDNQSLAREDFEAFLEVIPENVDPRDLLRSSYEYTSTFIASYINSQNIKQVLVTGGGAYNDFFISLLKQKVKGEIILPSDNVIEYKEALIFAFLGFLRVTEKNNVLKCVTQAIKDSLGGAIYG